MRVLKFDDDWNYEWPYGPLANDAYRDFVQIVERVAQQSANAWDVYEEVKHAFGNQSTSTSASWAESDAFRALSDAAKTPPVFLSAFWGLLRQWEKQGITVPSDERLNLILRKWSVPLHIDPPDLKLVVADFDEEEKKAGRSSVKPVFIKEELIGQGGFGTVYRVTRKTSAADFPCAMKVFDPSTFQKSRSRALERFKREMEILAKLQHRGIIGLIEAGFDEDNVPYIVMPLIIGRHLDDYAANEDRASVLQVFDGILDAISYSHEVEVLHRDLKPSNILVRESDDQPIILDFGCGFITDGLNKAAITTTQIGTARYIPPEVQDEPSLKTVKQDIYAIGVMLYESLSQLTFRSLKRKPLAAIEPVLKPVDTIVAKATAPAPERRYATASAFRQALRELEWSQ